MKPGGHSGPFNTGHTAARYNLPPTPQRMRVMLVPIGHQQTDQSEADIYRNTDATYQEVEGGYDQTRLFEELNVNSDEIYNENINYNTYTESFIPPKPNLLTLSLNFRGSFLITTSSSFIG